jgi:hypothetical protein
VQSAVFARLSEKEVTLFHESAVALLSTAFPNNWNVSGPQQGHSWKAWETCSKVLPHVSWLVDLSKKHKIRPADPYPFAEVIFRTGAWVTVAPMLKPSLTTFQVSMGARATHSFEIVLRIRALAWSRSRQLNLQSGCSSPWSQCTRCSTANARARGVH